VLIPAANVKHLMLRQDVVEAVAQERFSVHAIATIDEGLELLTGLAAGERGEDGRFPPSSVNGRVEHRLTGFSKRLLALHAESRADEDRAGGDPPETP
jgi:predicted ATP-dependent protease